MRHVQPAHEYDKHLEQDEGDEQQDERARVPVQGVLAVRVVETDLPARFAADLLGLEFEFVLDTDLLEHHFVSGVPVPDAPLPSKRTTTTLITIIRVQIL